jgi:hypothetical protein
VRRLALWKDADPDIPILKQAKTWESLIRGGLDRDEHQRVSKALLDYCGQDTLALVILWLDRLPM